MVLMAPPMAKMTPLRTMRKRGEGSTQSLSLPSSKGALRRIRLRPSPLSRLPDADVAVRQPRLTLLPLCLIPAAYQTESSREGKIRVVGEGGAATTRLCLSLKPLAHRSPLLRPSERPTLGGRRKRRMLCPRPTDAVSSNTLLKTDSLSYAQGAQPALVVSK